MVTSTSLVLFIILLLKIPTNNGVQSITDPPAWIPGVGEEPVNNILTTNATNPAWMPDEDPDDDYEPPPFQSEPPEPPLFDTSFEDTNPSDINGNVLFQSDIVLTEDQKPRIKDRIMQWVKKRWPVEDNGYYGLADRAPLRPHENDTHSNTNSRTNRKANLDISTRWPEKDGFPFVPYLFYKKVDQTKVLEALDHWMEHTCIVFKKIEKSETKQPHLQFFKGIGCWSYVGYIWYWFGQPVSIGYNCNALGVVAHEVGHALGFWHEQSRSIRDDHVVVNMENVIPGLQGNFATTKDEDFGVEYDVASDMHYGSRFFTNGGNLTIATRDPLQQELLASRNGLTHRDKLMANRMYNCIEKWMENCSITEDPCRNEGYLGKNCTCVCPEHTSGEHCETVNGDYYDHLRSIKTEVITEEKTIVTQFFNDKFTKHIIAPECMTPQVNFTSFEMYGTSRTSYGTYCYFEFLNIRNGTDPYDGMIFCGDQIQPGDVFTSTTRELILYTESNYYGSSMWTAELTFENTTDCDEATIAATETGGANYTGEPDPNQKESLSCISSIAAYGGGTPLIRAAAAGYIDIVSSLISNEKVDMDVTLPDGSTAMSVAAAMGYEKIVDILLNAGANPNIYKGSCNGSPSQIFANTTGLPSGDIPPKNVQNGYH